MKVYPLMRSYSYGSQRREEPIYWVLVIDFLTGYWTLTSSDWQYHPSNNLTLVAMLWAPLKGTWEDLLEAE